MFDEIKEYNPKDIESEILEFYQEKEIFGKLVNKNKGNTPFRSIDGPITANNPMGVHHAWGRTLKDIIIRYKAMKGFDQRYQNGFDCQGLWVEVEVEKSLGLKTKKDILNFGLDNFSKACRERVKLYAKKIIEQSIRLGQWMDCEGSYYTMDDHNIESIWFFLRKCHENGWIYKGHRVLPWCARCGTGLSEHELTDSYIDTTHTAVYLKLPILKDNTITNEYLLVWTTTPWTLPANVALAVHPEILYVKMKMGNDYYYLSEKTLSCVKDNYEIVERIQGSHLFGIKYQGAFDNLPVAEDISHKVILWEEVSDTEGTGIVHIAPGCGEEDYDLGQELGLNVISPIDENGDYIEGFGTLTGRNVTDNKTTKFILDVLKERDYLYKAEDYKHRYPVCWRCKNELIFLLSDEWFISCDEIRDSMIEEIKKVDWIPDHIEKRMKDWLTNMGDWNISRKRFWGLPLPFYPCDCGRLTVIGSIKELQSLATTDISNLPELHRPWLDEIKMSCPNCGKEVGRIPEVGDCWLDAGIVPFSTLKYFKDKDYWQKWFHAEYICEMREQIRLWYYSLLFMSLTLENCAPYKTVVSYEKVYDEKGEEMHKTGRNVIWLDDAVDNMVADVMRWIYASQKLSKPLNFGYTLANDVKNKIMSVWNCYSFFTTYANIDKPELLKTEATVFSPVLLDRWIISKLNKFLQEIEDAYEIYDTVKIMKMFELFIEDLSNWYIRRSRRRFWKTQNDLDKKWAYITLYEVLTKIIKAIAPILPFLTEKLYQNLVRNINASAPESIHLCDFPRPNLDAISQELETHMDIVRTVVKMGLTARNKAGIKVRQPLKSITILCKSSCDFLNESELINMISEDLNIKKVILEKIERLKDFEILTVKPNYSTLGPKYKKYVLQIENKLNEINTNKLYAELKNKGKIILAINDKTIEINEEDVTFQSMTRDGYVIEKEDDVCVALDITLDDSLIGEGMLRDLIRFIQVTRKELGFEIADKIILYFKGPKCLREVVYKNVDYLREEIQAVDIKDQSPEKHREPDTTIRLRGDDVIIWLERVVRERGYNDV
jgi:isoleucyl-tRNA synthetase